MLAIFDSARLYHLDPMRQEDVEKDWSSIAWIKFDDSVKTLSADQIAHKFTEFGDFNIYKDHHDSCYIEFYYYDPAKVKEGNLQSFIDSVNSKKEEYGIEIAAPYQEAVKFKAHNRLE
jgi:hypothetical protein